LEISDVDRNRFAQLVLDNFTDKFDRPLLAAILIYIAEHPECTTVTIKRRFKITSPTGGYEKAMGLTHNFLNQLRDQDLLENDKSARFVPTTMRRDGRPGLGKIVQEHTAKWRVTTKKE